MKREQFAEGAPVYRAGTLQRWRAFGKGWSLLLVGLMPLLAGAQGMRQAWVARYNGPSSSLDSASALAVDSQGNVYVTGRSVGSGTGFDYATVKYDTNGRQLWVARYNGPGTNWDEATALAVDSQGNVYVTGRSDGTGADYLTIKYDTNGRQLWVARYNGPGNGEDYPFALAVDSQGNVYVTGRSEGSGTGFDYATVKYDTNGRQLWVARYNGPGNRGDAAAALAVDGQGNVYVTGVSEGSGTSGDYATVKYDTNGRQLWVARYNGPGNGLDSASALAVDSRGNLYVTGYSVVSGTDWDYATIKYVPCPGPCPGDVDGSRLVDDSDLLRVLFAFGQVGDRPEDLNCDGVVDDADLLIVLFNFGRRC